jgi:hypothetical protein
MRKKHWRRKQPAAPHQTTQQQLTTLEAEVARLTALKQEYAQLIAEYIRLKPYEEFVAWEDHLFATHALSPEQHIECWLAEYQTRFGHEQTT